MSRDSPHGLGIPNNGPWLSLSVTLQTSLPLVATATQSGYCSAFTSHTQSRSELLPLGQCSILKFQNRYVSKYVQADPINDIQALKLYAKS